MLRNKRTRHEQLSTLNAGLAELCGLAGDAMQRATGALLDGDLALTDQVIADHDHVIAMKARTEEDAFVLLALRAPVAGELRVVVSSIQTAADVERMSALATQVANIVRDRHPCPAVPNEVRTHFAQMGQLAVRLGHRAQQVIISGDPRTTAHIRHDDDAMDTLHRQLMMVLMRRRWYLSATAAVDITLLGHLYERFGDHAVAIGRRVVFQPRPAGMWAPA